MAGRLGEASLSWPGASRLESKEAKVPPEVKACLPAHGCDLPHCTSFQAWTTEKAILRFWEKSGLWAWGRSAAVISLRCVAAAATGNLQLSSCYCRDNVKRGKFLFFDLAWKSLRNHWETSVFDVSRLEGNLRHAASTMLEGVDFCFRQQQKTERTSLENILRMKSSELHLLA